MGGGYQYPWQWETLGDIMWDGEEKAMHNQQTTSFFKVLGWHPIFLYMYSKVFLASTLQFFYTFMISTQYLHAILFPATCTFSNLQVI